MEIAFHGATDQPAVPPVVFEEEEEGYGGLVNIPMHHGDANLEREGLAFVAEL